MHRAAAIRTVAVCATERPCTGHALPGSEASFTHESARARRACVRLRGRSAPVVPSAAKPENLPSSWQPPSTLAARRPSMPSAVAFTSYTVATVLVPNRARIGSARDAKQLAFLNRRAGPSCRRGWRRDTRSRCANPRRKAASPVDRYRRASSRCCTLSAHPEQRDEARFRKSCLLRLIVRNVERSMLFVTTTGCRHQRR